MCAPKKTPKNRPFADLIFDTQTEGLGKYIGIDIPWKSKTIEKIDPFQNFHALFQETIYLMFDLDPEGIPYLDGLFSLLTWFPLHFLLKLTKIQLQDVASNDCTATKSLSLGAIPAT